MDKANNKKFWHILGAFISELGVPEHLSFDGSAVQFGTKTIFQNHVRKHEIQTQRLEPRISNENPSEGSIWEVKRKWYQMQANKNIPDRLWYYGIDYISETKNRTVNSSTYSDERNPLEIITGETSDLSEYLDFGFYDWVTYQNNAGLGFPKVCRWLGVSHQVVHLISYWILPELSIPVFCITVQRITNLEKQTDE